MAVFSAKAMYEKIKSGENRYVESIHCPMVLEVMNNPKLGTMTAFCKKALISQASFWRWCQQNPLLNECYQIGKILSKSNWEKEGEDNKDNPDFDFKYWRAVGNSRYQHGKDVVYAHLDSQSNPFEQYKQICLQASQGEFSASELKQVMESINVGLRAYELHELQNQFNEMKQDVLTMKVNNGDVVSANESIAENNTDTVPHKVC